MTLNLFQGDIAELHGQQTIIGLSGQERLVVYFDATAYRVVGSRVDFEVSTRQLFIRRGDNIGVLEVDGDFGYCAKKRLSGLPITVPLPFHLVQLYATFVIGNDPRMVIDLPSMVTI